VRNNRAWCLVDARAPERYAGEIEPIDPLAGHVPGAINAYWKLNVDEHGCFLGRAELSRRFGELLGETPSERVVCYCGSGVTACHLLLALEAAGLHGAHLYVGSWSEWCRTRAGAI
jgi:thiosulfate/3-mercaptopyruvate sulfurtransferase